MGAVVMGQYNSVQRVKGRPKKEEEGNRRKRFTLAPCENPSRKKKGKEKGECFEKRARA